MAALASDARFDIAAISDKRRQIDERIKADDDRLYVIREGLKKSTALSKGMAEMLTSFENRLVALESSIRPVHDETLSLTSAQEHITSTIKIFETGLANYDVVSDVAPVLLAGPGENLKEFLRAMQRIQTALQFFAKETPKGSEVTVSLLKSQQESGLNSLEAEFRSVVSNHSKNGSQKKSIDDLLAGAWEDASADGASVATKPLMPEATIVALTTMASWLADAGRLSSFSAAYAELRSAHIVDMLQSLVVSQMYASVAGSVPGARAGTRPAAITGPSVDAGSSLAPSASVASAASITSASSASATSDSSAANAAVDSMKIRRMTAAFQHKRTSSTIGLPGKEKKSGESELTAMAYEKGTHPFLDTITVFLRQMKAERVLAQRVLPAAHFDVTFSTLCKAPLEHFITSIESIASKGKRQLGKGDCAIVFELLNILELLRGVSKELQRALEAGDRDLVIDVAISTISTLCNRGLHDFEDATKNDSSSKSKLSLDGTVHVLTRNTVAYLLKLFQYRETAEQLLRESVGQAAGSTNQLVAYMNRIVSFLTKNIEAKSDAYESHILGIIFKLNNFHYMLKTVRKSPHMAAFGPEFEATASELIHACLYDYQVSWKKAIEYILEVNRNQTKQPKAGKLSKSERSAIKDKFKGFNHEFDEVYRTQKSYTISDPELRDQLRRDNVTLIIPLYSKFLERYKDEPFSKTPEKYLKYDAATLESMLNKFFDVSS
ncbi:hypothetical protein CAOG_08940 [Capsaspora owczarzaki ATCC 30864]|uniref:Exocyst subunit Exo70 family protein n=1 Tax=Capsaspora owczarzaki (strain ATCC 30864) TaxID=595528 RepID=A0A0D2X486_CAPO3|nr:hypothetical protein CAOG_08940 [Capsaspora owczarzaki ATCC 30864]KJE95624.1 hypothetical protein CAOG_008940 [Capsaspora owczarzaki ATCC 30864]|eukprot:XP_011270611.1 hypothetical protein CAOG_08940 [Capsaspora owczarzaki ATCC 30864]